MIDDASKEPSRRGPVLIDYSAPIDQGKDESRRSEAHQAPRHASAINTGPSPAEVPPVDDWPGDTGSADGRAMRMVTALLRRQSSPLTNWFLWTSFALVGFLVVVAAWRYVLGLITAQPSVGWVAAGLLATFLFLALGVVFREWLAFTRMGRIDSIRKSADAALASGDNADATKVTKYLDALYKGRPEMELPRESLAERQGETVDAMGLLQLAESKLMAPLDAAARLEIEATARTVATVTALVPLALVDVITALAANLRMIRNISSIYGGRASLLGNLTLVRKVVTHIVVTGVVAAGDDLVETVAGGGLLSTISRRFGEGVLNGALTARVGVAAMEVCRPLSFISLDRPRAGTLVRDALIGVFDR